MWHRLKGIRKLAYPEMASLIVLVHKKDITFRFPVDNWHLNPVTIPNIYLLPRMNNYIDSLGETYVFTAYDALWEHWKDLFKGKNKYKMTVTPHLGTNSNTRMPFGV